MNYQHIARLAELVEQISDAKWAAERMTAKVEVSGGFDGPDVEIALYSWGSYGQCSGIWFSTNKNIRDVAYTTADLIKTLEQIEHYGFREQEEAA